MLRIFTKQTEIQHIAIFKILGESKTHTEEYKLKFFKNGEKLYEV
jgi:hypothetical protein